MKLKQLLTKSLLVMAGLCVGASAAWADGTKRVLNAQNYEYVVATDWKSNTATVSLQTGDATYGNYAKNEVNGSGNRAAYKSVAFGRYLPDGYTTSNMATKGYVIEFDMRMAGGQQQNRSSSQFIVPTIDPNLKKNENYTGTDYIFALSQPTNSTGELETTWYINDLTNASNSFTLEDAWHHYKLVVSSTSVDYTITKVGVEEPIATGSKTVTSLPTLTGFWGLTGRTYGYFTFDNLEIYDFIDGEVVSDPTIGFPAYAGANRTVTITTGSSSQSNAVTTYYTIDGTDPSASNFVGSFTTASEDVIISSNSTVKAISISSTEVSSNIFTGVAIKVGKLPLNAPTYKRTGYTNNKYKVELSQDQSNLEYVPASSTIKYSIDGGETQNYSAAFDVTEGSTVTAWVEAENYTNSTNTIIETNVRPVVSSTAWSQDYTDLTTSSGDGHKQVVLSSTPFEVNGTNFYNIVGYTHNGATVDITVDNHVGLNTATNYALRHKGANSGILQNGKSSQYIGFQNLTVNNILVITSSGDNIEANYGLTLIEEISTNKEYYFKINSTTASVRMYNGTYSYVYTISEIVPKWSAPTITPSDFSDGNWTVTLTGPSGSTLQYKVDSGEYQTYSTPFTAASGAEVKAKATGGDYNDSDEASATMETPVVATPTFTIASYNYERGGYAITPACETEGATLTYKVGNGSSKSCTAGEPFYAKNGKLVITASKAGWTSASTPTTQQYTLNVAPSSTSPETLIAFQTSDDNIEKNVAHVYKSVTIAGGSNSAVGGRNGDGLLKLRTNQNDNTITLSVNSGYRVTGVALTANSNNSGSGATINLTSVTVDGGSNIMTGTTTFPISGSSATYNTGTIAAENSIVFTFDNSNITDESNKKNRQIIASIVVTYMTPTEVEVANAIADCKTYETSAAFALHIDGLLAASSLNSANDVYAAHTAWQIANGTPSKAILNNTITSTDHFWGTLTEGADYDGAPDTKYLANTAGSDYNVNQIVYQLPAGVYRASAWTYSSIAGWRKIYVSKVPASGSWEDLITPSTSTQGWVEVSGEFTLTEPANIAFGLYASAVDGRVAGIDNWTLTLTGVPVSVSSAGYATYVNSGYDLDFSETTIKAYKVKVNAKGVATMTKVDQVPAGTPVLLYAEGGASEYVPVTTGAAAVSDNDLVAGTTTTATDGIPTTDGAYTNMILNNVGGKIGFYFANGKTVATNRAYLHIPTEYAPDEVGAGARMSMVFADEATGIKSVLGTEVKSDGYYNLNGQRVSQPAKGLYIVNGKKVIIK